MIKRALTASCIAVIAAGYTHAAGPWVRGYVVGFYDPAFRYGGRADYSRGTEIEPGVDCPHGSTVHFAIPAQVDYEHALLVGYALRCCSEVRWREFLERWSLYQLPRLLLSLSMNIW